MRNMKHLWKQQKIAFLDRSAVIDQQFWPFSGKPIKMKKIVMVWQQDN